MLGHDTQDAGDLLELLIGLTLWEGKGERIVELDFIFEHARGCATTALSP